MEGFKSEPDLAVLCATDDRYAPYCGIMLTSLLENNKELNLKVYVFVNGELSNSNKHKFYQLGETYKCPLELVVVDEAMLRPIVPIYTTNHVITLPTYYRLLAADLLPADLHRVLYLDCDMVVTGDLRFLSEVSLEDAAVGVVKDCVFNANEEPYQRLGYPMSSGYFNAGMLVMNLDFWRTHAVRHQLEEFIGQKKDALYFMDQDALNGVLYNQKVMLPERYNMQTEYFYRKPWNSYSLSFQETLKAELKNAVVIHYCGSMKPWQFLSTGLPFQEKWDEYRRISLWKHCRSFLPLQRHLKWMVKRVFFPIRWRKQRRDFWALDDKI